MNQHVDSTAEPEGQTETRDVGDVIDIIANALNLNELVYMAGDSLWHDGSKLQGEAIMVGVGAVRDMLMDATAVLYANIGQGNAS